QNVELIVNIEPSTQYIVGDKIRLRQILLNLLSNAAKFTQNGSISLSTRSGDTPDSIIICVEDSGTGIDQSTLPRIFDIFEQGKNAIYPESSGTGLGLSIVRELVQLHNGKITVDSKVGEGTTFFIHLPRSQSGQVYSSPHEDNNIISNETGSEEDIQTNEVQSKTQAVLLVDDDPVIFKLYHKYLSRAPIELISASNGVDAIDWLKDKRFDISMIILDLHMPEMDGWETLKKIQMSSLADQIPVVISSVEPDRKKAAEFGIEYVMPKPVKYADLQKLTAMVLKN
ncbi:MAG: ATP-binding protein, partial [Chloroflexota bacterium]